MIKYYWRRLTGWWKLLFGFCPLCDSSPPKEFCYVCHGSYIYGHEASMSLRALWRERYIRELKDARKSA